MDAELSAIFVELVEGDLVERVAREQYLIEATPAK